MKKTAVLVGLIAGMGGCNGAIVGGDGSGGAAGRGSIGEDAGSTAVGSAGSTAVGSAGSTAVGTAGSAPVGSGGHPSVGTAGSAPTGSGGHGGVSSGGQPTVTSGGYGGGYGGDPAVGTAGSAPVGSGATAGWDNGEFPHPGTAGAANGGTITPAASCNVATDAWIAFDSDAADFNRDLYAIRPDGSQLTRLTTDVSVEQEPYFSPDGSSLSFTSDRDGTLQIYVLNLATRAVTQVTHRSEGASRSGFSPDSQRLAFHSGRSVYTIKLDGSEETLIKDGTDNIYDAPRFINDQLVFDHGNGIDAINLDGTNFRSVVGNWTTTIEGPSVSPTGTEIAYAAWCDNDTSISIWTTPATLSTQVCGGRRVSPTGDGLTNERPAWGPDNTIAYQRVDLGTNIGRITLNNRTEGSTPCSLTGPSDNSRNPNWSPVGLHL